MLVRTLSKHCNFDLYTMKFHLLVHVVDDLRVFGTPSVFDTLLLEQYNVNIMQVYRQNSRCSDTCINEIVILVEFQVDVLRSDLINPSSEAEMKRKRAN